MLRGVQMHAKTAIHNCLLSFQMVVVHLDGRFDKQLIMPATFMQYCTARTSKCCCSELVWVGHLARASLCTQVVSEVRGDQEPVVALAHVADAVRQILLGTTQP
jgi:hypothetical protein